MTAFSRRDFVHFGAASLVTLGAMRGGLARATGASDEAFAPASRSVFGKATACCPSTASGVAAARLRCAPGGSAFCQPPETFRATIAAETTVTVSANEPAMITAARRERCHLCDRIAS